MKMYESVEDLFIGSNLFAPQRDEAEKHFEYLMCKYEFLNSKALNVLFEYYTDKPKDATPSWSVMASRFHSGDLKPLALFNQLAKLGYEPSINI